MNNYYNPEAMLQAACVTVSQCHEQHRTCDFISVYVVAEQFVNCSKAPTCVARPLALEHLVVIAV